ncbi:MFS transporter [Pedococcus sp. KACC 23699]|uniref:MFS transporter n=1 Tax=Pedococcus sp. KACC 23699 TaxID=3149228 RepID=A0AAU7JSG5_9MICO
MQLDADTRHPAPRSGSVGPARVGPGFIARYAAAYMGTSLVLIAPVSITLALKVNALVGIARAPATLALVVGVGSLVALVGNPLVGRLSDRTTSRFGRRRPWMVLGLLGGTAAITVVATADTVGVVLVGWCAAQLCFNALLAVQVAVLPDQVPTAQRGLVSGILGVCLPIASVGATFLVRTFIGSQLTMFLAPCVVGGVCVLAFAATLDDRRLPRDDRPAWSSRELAGTFYFDPRRCPDFAWAFASRFLFVLAYAFLSTYQVYYLIDHLGTAEGAVPQQVFVATLVQATAVVVTSLVSGRVSDRLGRRKPFVAGAAVVYAVAMVVVGLADSYGGFLVGIAISGLGFGMYFAVDLALVADVLPDQAHAAKDLGVLNYAGALPFAVAPALAPSILAGSGGSYPVLYAVAAGCAALGAAAILPVKAAR